MRRYSPRALASGARHNRGKAAWALVLAMTAAISLAVAAGGLAAGSGNRIAVSRIMTKTLPKVEPPSPPGYRKTFAPDNATLSCAPQPNGQPATCTAIATLVGDAAPVEGVVLATYAHVFTSDESPIPLVFGLSQNTLDLLYQRPGDPRCTVTVAIVNDSSAAGQTGTGPQPADAAGVGTQSPAPARSFSTYLNVPGP